MNYLSLVLLPCELYFTMTDACIQLLCFAVGCGINFVFVCSCKLYHQRGYNEIRCYISN